MDHTTQYWRDIAKRLRTEHPDEKSPADWTRKEARPFLDKLQEEVDLTISYATFRRVFKEGLLGKEETRDIFAKYYGYESHRAYIDENIKKRKLQPKGFWRWSLLLIGIAFLIVGFVYRDKLSCPKLISNDKAAVIEVVKKAVDAEYAIYQAIPNYDEKVEELGAVFWSDAAAYKKIVRIAEGQTAYGWTLNNRGNPSGVKLQEIQLDSIIGGYAYVSTKEHWDLEWYGLKSRRYEYLYNVINKQQYILTENPSTGKWKVSSNKYDDNDLVREIPEFESCESLNKSTKNRNNLEDAIATAAASGNVNLLLKIIDCYHQVKIGTTPPTDLLLLLSDKNDLYRDLNTDKISYELFKTKKKTLILDVLEYVNSLHHTNIAPSLVNDIKTTNVPNVKGIK